MLELNKDLFIGKGVARSCYEHPNNPNQCIKIVRPNGSLKHEAREIRYYKHLQKSDISWEHISRFIKTEQTSLGHGVVFDLIRDEDGEISKPIDFYLRQNTRNLNKIIVDGLEELKCYLTDQNIVFKDLTALNILLQKKSNNEFKLVIIDGIGHSEFIPICYIPYFGKKKIKRTWNRNLKRWFSMYDNVFHLISPYY